MKRHMNDAEHNEHLEQPRTGLVQQQFISLEIRADKLTRKTITRTFIGDSYTDSLTTEVLCNAQL